MNKDSMFQNRDFWESTRQSELVQSKLPIIFDWIPHDVKTILDVGCGNGIITNALSEKFDVTGADYSATALEFVTGKKVHSSAEKLPFEDQSFDMVFSSEMLEHLSDELLVISIEEMKRVSKGYIFLTVPNKEFLQKSFIKCPRCKTAFHVYGHLHSFQIKDLDDLIGPCFKRYMQGTFGPKEKKYNPALLKIRQKIADRWFQSTEHTICPHCGNKEFARQKGNLLSMLCNGLNWLISGTQRYWLFAFYDKKDI
jgi:ubiquinone/menaquinone biosynthesis C-methylase UbiE